MVASAPGFGWLVVALSAPFFELTPLPIFLFFPFGLFLLV